MALKYKHLLLLVDDEESVTNAIQRAFRKEPYEIHAASSGQEALGRLKESEKPFSLIISDQRMPEMTGTEFFEKAKKIAPHAARILLTGHSDMAAIVAAVNRGEIHRYLTKPWRDDDLLLQVKNSLEQYELVLENRKLLALTKRQNEKLKELNRNLEAKIAERSKEIIEKNKELESGLYNTVRAFGSLVEMHSPLLAGHGRRVSVMSREIARLLELNEQEITQIEVAGLLHDVGKLGLPAKLLDYQESRWGQQDIERYRNHPKEGQTTVQFIERLDHVGLLIRSHHEQYDGNGYPDRLAEEEIPLGSRIIAVANSYDKIVNLKVDKGTFLKEVARESDMVQDHLPEHEALQKAAILNLRQYGFTRYDPDIVKAFLGLLKTKGVSYGREKPVSISDLNEGMILSRSIYSAGGKFLLPHNTTLTRNHIAKLAELHRNNPINDAIYIVEK